VEEFVREKSAEACREQLERPAATAAEEEARIGWERVVAAQIAGAGFAGLAAGCEDAMRAKKFRDLAPPMTTLRKL
jgi:hypothetical protein